MVAGDRVCGWVPVCCSVFPLLPVPPQCHVTHTYSSLLHTPYLLLHTPTSLFPSPCMWIHPLPCATLWHERCGTVSTCYRPHSSPCPIVCRYPTHIPYLPLYPTYPTPAVLKEKGHMASTCTYKSFPHIPEVARHWWTVYLPLPPLPTFCPHIP